MADKEFVMDRLLIRCNFMEGEKITFIRKKEAQ
jgi:hypothetical protein